MNLKNLRSTLVLAFVLFYSSLLAQDSSKATIIIYRPNTLNSSSTVQSVVVNGGNSFYLYNNSFIKMESDTGIVQIQVKKNSESRLNFRAAAGQTYYVRMLIVPGFFSVSYEFVLEQETTARMHLKHPKLYDLSKPYFKPRTRIGFDWAFGFGFQETVIAQTTDNRDVRFSPGGGISVGLTLGHEVMDYFDVSGSVRYASSGLMPNVENGSMDFSRVGISLSPAFVIPIKGGITQRMRVFAGLDLNLSNEMAIRLGKLQGGFNDNWTYTASTGYHAGFVYESHINRNWSTLMGMYYSSMNYSFLKSTNFSVPLDPKLTKPDGSELMFRFGISYHL